MKWFVLLFVVCIGACQNGFGQYLDWAKRIGGPYTDYAIAIAMDAVGNIYVTGSFQGSADFDPGPGALILQAYNVDAFIAKYDQHGALFWARSFGGVNSDSGDAIFVDSLGYVYVTGKFQGVVDLDPGPGVYTATSSGGMDGFVLKLSTNGLFEWARATGGSGVDRPTDISVDSDGNVYTIGTFVGSVDFDPGAGNFTLTSQGWGDVFIRKLTASGSFVWAKRIGGSYVENGSSLEIDKHGSLFCSGTFFSSMIDVDPSGSGTTWLNPPNQWGGAFLVKLDTSGSFSWGRVLPGCLGDFFPQNGIGFDQYGSVYIGGYFRDSLDFDPGPSSFEMVSAGYEDAYVEKLDPNGNFVWAKRMGGTNVDVCYSLTVDAIGNVYTTGTFSNTPDFDPGLGTFYITALGANDAYIQKLDSNGNLVWVKALGGVGKDVGCNIILDSQGNLIMSGAFSETADFDPSPLTAILSSAGDYDGFLWKLTEDSCSSLTWQLDSLRNITCAAPIGFVSGAGLGGMPPYNYLWDTSPVSTDSFAQFTSAGLYTVTITASNTCVTTRQVLINGPTTTGFDLGANLWASNFRPGLTSNVRLDALNHGCTSMTGQLQLVYHGPVSYLSASPTPSSIAGDTLIWVFSNLAYDSQHIAPQIQFQTAVFATMGDTVHFETSITPILGDIHPYDNLRDDYDFLVVNSFDPNDKVVYPPGTCDAHLVKIDGQPLTYTIHFQNTGNAEALQVQLLDTLDPLLDLHTLQVIAQSHPLSTEILPGNILRFNFQDINLPDSTTDEPGSHGYVIFEIKPVAGLTSGTRVFNRSAIYFDYNLPVITNRTFTTLVDTIATYLYQDTVHLCRYGNHTFPDGYTAGNILASFTHQSHFSSRLYCDSVILTTVRVAPIDTNVIVNGFSLTAQAAGANYTWLDCGNSMAPVLGAINQTFTSPINGTFAVAILQFGCSDTTSCYATNLIGVPAATSGIDFEIFPNPATHILHLQGVSKIKSIWITDAVGQLVMRFEVNGRTDLSVDIAHLPRGLYFVMADADGYVRKFILQ